MSRRVAVIFGAGAGTGASIARAFAKTHSVFLLSRSLPGSLPKLNLNIPENKVLAASSDGSNDSLKAAFEVGHDLLALNMIYEQDLLIDPSCGAQCS